MYKVELNTVSFSTHCSAVAVGVRQSPQWKSNAQDVVDEGQDTAYSLHSSSMFDARHTANQSKLAREVMMLDSSQRFR